MIVCGRDPRLYSFSRLIFGALITSSEELNQVRDLSFKLQHGCVIIEVHLEGRLGVFVNLLKKSSSVIIYETCPGGPACVPDLFLGVMAVLVWLEVTPLSIN